MLPAPPAEVPVCSSTAQLAPKFVAALLQMLALMRAQGYDPVVYETYRTPERQAFLFGFGRTYDDGRGVVTHAPDTTKTWHGYGLAADVISASKEWDAPASFWLALGAAAAKCGLTWGGNWPIIERDKPHVQWGAPMRQTPSDEAVNLKQQGGDAAVWTAVGAS